MEDLNDSTGQHESPEPSIAPPNSAESACSATAPSCKCLKIPTSIKLGLVAVAVVLLGFNLAVLAVPGLSERIGHLLP